MVFMEPNSLLQPAVNQAVSTMPIGPQSLQNFQASNFDTDTNVGVWKAKQDANSAIASQLAGLY
jgi:hypothetical protein